MRSEQPVLGVDVGGVIISRLGDDGGDTSFFGKNYLLTPAVPDVFEVLGRLQRGAFAGRIHVVSKCGESVEGKTRKWLRRHDFEGLTGVTEEQLHFCRRREDKGPIAEDLGITHFIDDRTDVLTGMPSVEHRLLFTGGNPAEDAPADPLPGIVRVNTWAEAEAALLRTLETLELSG